MEIKVSPLVKEPAQYGFEYRKLRNFLKAKKTAQRYDANGEKVFRLKDNQASGRKSRPVVLKHEKFHGPFVLALYKTDSDIHTGPAYTYQGYIKVDAGEYAYIYRDSLEEYPEAYWCDDTTLFLDVRNKEAGTKYAVGIDGEPTGMECWNFGDPANDDAEHSHQKQMLQKKKQLAQELGLPEGSVHVIIQLDV